MDLLDIVLYFAVAAISGAVNAVAGGGTFLTFPVLILGGLSAVSANIMSTIALWPGAVASAFAYRSEIENDRQALIIFRDFLKKSILVSILGSILGTAILLMTPEVTFQALVPWLLLFASCIFTFGKRGFRFFNLFGEMNPRRRFAGYALQFAIAVYGGYFGAGIGILMLAMLQLMGMREIHQMNALKTILGSAINGVAWIIFAFSGKIVWDLAIIMIAGGIFGGYFGARIAVRVPPEKVRILVSVIAFAMTAYFFVK
jgi:uncharacterized protein